MQNCVEKIGAVWEEDYDGFFTRNPYAIERRMRDQPFGPVDALHYHNFIEIGYCYSGNGIFFIDGKTLLFHAPCVTVVYPGQLHLERSVGNERSKWQFFAFRADKLMAGIPSLYAQLPFGCAKAESTLVSGESIISLVKEVQQEYESGFPNKLECMQGLLIAILARHSRLPRGTNSEDRHTNLDKISAVLTYINAHFQEELDADMLAKWAHMHPATMRRLFNEAIGETAVSYIRRLRFSAACSLLRGTGRSVTEIASEVGYGSLSSFNRHFYELCACSPSEYRKKQ